MTIDEIWNLYNNQHPEASAYEAWAFCGGGPMGDALAQLVLDGIKTATASSYDVYMHEEGHIPAQGNLSIVLWSNGEAACIVKTTDVTVRKFCEVTPEHAYLEGEDDRSLDMWRQGHRKFFTMDLEQYGLSFSEDIKVVCEVFQVVYTAE